jgi:hypothetical protein
MAAPWPILTGRKARVVSRWPTMEHLFRYLPCNHRRIDERDLIEQASLQALRVMMVVRLGLRLQALGPVVSYLGSSHSHLGSQSLQSMLSEQFRFEGENLIRVSLSQDFLRLPHREVRNFRSRLQVEIHLNWYLTMDQLQDYCFLPEAQYHRHCLQDYHL